MNAGGHNRARSQPAIGRADLLLAWRARGNQELDDAAAALGYERRPPEPHAVDVVVPPPTRRIIDRSRAARRATSFAPSAFLRPDRLEDHGPPSRGDGAGFQPPRRTPAPPWPELSPWPTLEPRVSRLLGRELGCGPLDVAVLVDRMARLEAVESVPRSVVRRASPALTVLVDFASRLTPMWQDHEAVVARIMRSVESSSCRVEFVPPDVDPLDAFEALKTPWHDRDLLVLSDLGIGHVHASTETREEIVGRYGDAAAQSWEETRVRQGLAAARCWEEMHLRDMRAAARSWQEIGRRVHHAGGRALALLPCGRGGRGGMDGVPEPWETAAWESTVAPTALLGEALERLLALLSPLSRIDRGLLRELARALGLPGGAALETAAQVHPAVDGRFSETIAIADEQRKAWRRTLANAPVDDLRALVACLKRWHGWLGPEVMYEELVTLADLGCGHAIDPEDLRDAQRFFEGVAAEERRGPTLPGHDPRSAARARWLERVVERTGELSWDRSSALSSIGRIFYAMHRDNPNVEPPPGLEPAPSGAVMVGDGVPQALDVFHRFDRLLFVPAGQHGSFGPMPGRPASHLGRLRFVEPSVVVEPPSGGRRSIVRLDADREVGLAPFGGEPDGPAEALTLRTDCCDLHVTIARREPWQTALGRDRHGLWCAFELAGVEHRMRWIPPGTFWMGSPKEEIDMVLASLSPAELEEWRHLFDREVPRHQVTITRGFWLGEVPVTQRQWQPVMESNPSQFQSPDRPVEQVSWLDAKEFLAKANGLDAALELRLPWECEWEHACRAGTEAATFVGPMVIRGTCDAPVLDSIAWYAGNSAEGFELENGVDNGDWPQKSGTSGKAGTHRAGEKPANPWGLRDILGNVWEWCEDGLRAYSEAVEVDPRGPEGEDVDHVCRGGAWNSLARRVRSGYRDAVDPSNRWLGLGFRLARGPAGESMQVRAAPGRSEPRSGEVGRRGTRRAARRAKPDGSSPS